MSKRVFDSYHVTDEELAGVRQALDQTGIEWFETEKGRWWVGSAGIWVKHDNDFEKARQAIEIFEADWQKNVQADAANQTVNSGIRWNRVPVFILVAGILLYLLSFGFRM